MTQSINHAFREHSEGTQRILKGTQRAINEHSERKRESDFIIPSEPKILRLVKY